MKRGGRPANNDNGNNNDNIMLPVASSKSPIAVKKMKYSTVPYSIQCVAPIYTVCDEHVRGRPNVMLQQRYHFFHLAANLRTGESTQHIARYVQDGAIVKNDGRIEN